LTPATAGATSSQLLDFQSVQEIAMQALSPILMMLLMFGVFYFILIRPQVKRQRETQEMLKKLDKGDTVITRGGLIGKITGSNGDVLVIELQEKVRVRVPRAYVEARYDEKTATAGDVVKSGKDAKAA
jgi:preprotein translocase subunit YajC